MKATEIREMTNEELAKKLEEIQLFLQAHRDHECLVAVAQVNAAPDRGFFDAILLHPVHRYTLGHKILFCVLVKIFHFKLLSVA